MAKQCNATVWRKDQLRRVGGKRRFAMHYNRGRCSRKAIEGSEFCRQHASADYKVLRYDDRKEQRNDD